MSYLQNLPPFFFLAAAILVAVSLACLIQAAREEGKGRTMANKGPSPLLAVEDRGFQGGCLLVIAVIVVGVVAPVGYVAYELIWALCHKHEVVQSPEWGYNFIASIYILFHVIEYGLVILAGLCLIIFLLKLLQLRIGEGDYAAAILVVGVIVIILLVFWGGWSLATSIFEGAGEFEPPSFLNH